MGSSKWPDGKTSSDWYSVAGLMMEMQREDCAHILIEIAPTVSNGQPDLLLRATGVPMEDSSAAPARSVSTSLTCSRSRHTSLEGALIGLLYQLDFTMAVQLEDEAPE